MPFPLPEAFWNVRAPARVYMSPPLMVFPNTSEVTDGTTLMQCISPSVMKTDPVLPIGNSFGIVQLGGLTRGVEPVLQVRPVSAHPDDDIQVIGPMAVP